MTPTPGTIAIPPQTETMPGPPMRGSARRILIMKARIEKYLSHWKILSVFFIYLIFLPVLASSATSEDYAPLVGTKWFFTFDVGGTIYEDTITFDPSAYESEGNFFLGCTSSFYNLSAGVARFSASTSRYELFFDFTVEATSHWAYYSISVSKDTASGGHA